MVDRPNSQHTPTLDSRLCLLTDRRALPAGMPLAQVVAPAVGAGIGLVLFAETDLPPAQRAAVAGFVVDAVQGRCPVLIADSPALAAQVGAAGVFAMRAAPDGATAAVVHDEATVAAAIQTGAEWGLAAFDWSDPDSALARLRALAGLGLPLIAALDPPVEAAQACLQAGAIALCLSATVLSAPNPAAAVQAYRQALER